MYYDSMESAVGMYSVYWDTAFLPSELYLGNFRCSAQLEDSRRVHAFVKGLDISLGNRGEG